MTRKEIRDLSWGAELDKIVGETFHIWGVPELHFSSDIRAAWKIVEHMVERKGFTFQLGYEGGQFDASFNLPGVAHDEGGSCNYAETAPVVICIAALLAINKG